MTTFVPERLLVRLIVAFPLLHKTMLAGVAVGTGAATGAAFIVTTLLGADRQKLPLVFIALTV